MKTYTFSNPKWFTDDNGNKVPVYDGLERNICLKVREHYKRIQSMVDTYKCLYTVGYNIQYINNYKYVFYVKKTSRKVRLVEVEYYE